MVSKAEPRLTRSGVVDVDNPSNEGIRRARRSGRRAAMTATSCPA